MRFVGARNAAAHNNHIAGDGCAQGPRDQLPVWGVAPYRPACTQVLLGCQRNRTGHENRKSGVASDQPQQDDDWDGHAKKPKTTRSHEVPLFAAGPNAWERKPLHIRRASLEPVTHWGVFLLSFRGVFCFVRLFCWLVV